MQIRVAGWEDLADIYAIYCPYVRETAVSFETKEPSFAQFRRRFASVTADYPWLVAVDGETVIGYAYASRAFERAAYDWCCDLAGPRMTGAVIWRSIFAWKARIMGWHRCCMKR